MLTFSSTSHLNKQPSTLASVRWRATQGAQAQCTRFVLASKLLSSFCRGATGYYKSPLPQSHCSQASVHRLLRLLHGTKSRKAEAWLRQSTELPEPRGPNSGPGTEDSEDPCQAQISFRTKTPVFPLSFRQLPVLATPEHVLG